jgi:hypothetical protein
VSETDVAANASVQTSSTFRAFLAEHAWLVIGVLVAILASYGFAMTEYSISIDEEYHMITPQVAAWFEQQRYGIGLIKLLRMEAMPLPFFNMFISCCLLGLAALIWCDVLVRASDGVLAGSPALLAFAIFFATVPSNAYFLTFNTYNLEVGLGHAASALAVHALFRWIFQRGGFGALLLGAVCVLLAISIYQSFVFAFAAGVVAVAAVAIGTGASWRLWLGIVVAGALLDLGAAGLLFGLGRVVAPDQPYLDSLFNWGKLEPDFIVQWITESARRTYVGEAFIGGQSIPMLLLIGLAGCVGVMIRAPVRVLVVAVAVLLAVFPFFLSVAMGTAMPLRSQQTLPIAFGALLILGGLGSAGITWLRPVWLAVSALLLVWHGEANTRLFFSEYRTYQRDLAIADDIADDLAEQGWRGERIALVVVGQLPMPAETLFVSSETFGASQLNWEQGGRLPYFMRQLGYSVEVAGPSRQRAASAEAASMPAWPAPGSVRLQEGLAIVRVGDDAAVR